MPKNQYYLEAKTRHFLNEYPLGNCAEADAVNQALNQNGNLRDLYLYTIETTQRAFGKAKKACENCTFTFKGNVA